MEFKLPYYVSNGGDGSANVCFTETFAQAKEFDEAQPEGWGESSARIIRLKVENGKLYCHFYSGSYQQWVEILQ